MARLVTVLLAAVLVTALVACGGGDTGVRIAAATARGGTATPPPGASVTTAASATVVALPARPDNPFAGGIAVSAYLAGGGADLEHCLPALEQSWKLTPVDGPRCLSADIDGDGLKEFVYLVTIAGDPQPPGEVWFFDDARTGYRFFSSARALANQVLAGVKLVGAADVTGDGNPDVVITDQQCDATNKDACSTGLIVASEHTGTLTDLAPADSALAATTSVKIDDVNGDSLADVVMTSDASASAAAGPQPGLTRDLTWNGIGFAVHDTPGTPVYLINVIDDADAAFRGGDLATAAKLYEQAATDGTLKDWKAETNTFVGRRELVPYAYFRAALVAQRQGDAVAVRDLLTKARTGHEDSMLGIAATTYLAALNAGQPPAQACTGAKQYLTQFADAYARFWDYGFSNPEHAIADLC